MDPFTYYGDGRGTSSENALEIFRARMPEDKNEADRYECALNRFIYLAERLQPIKPKFHKGQYGKKYDSYTCGACGHVVAVTYRFCSNCGREINWRV